jgi:hypothetical protein
MPRFPLMGMISGVGSAVGRKNTLLFQHQLLPLQLQLPCAAQRRRQLLMVTWKLLLHLLPLSLPTREQVM